MLGRCRVTIIFELVAVVLLLITMLLVFFCQISSNEKKLIEMANYIKRIEEKVDKMYDKMF